MTTDDLKRCADCTTLLDLDAGEAFVTDGGEILCADDYDARGLNVDEDDQ